MIFNCCYSNVESKESSQLEMLRATQLVVSHGSSPMSISTLMHDIKRFHSDQGYIAYAPLMGLPAIAVLGDPVAPPDSWPCLLAEFISSQGQNLLLGQKTLIFTQVSSTCACVLSQLGLKVNMMGGETEIDVHSYKLSGHAKRGLRQSIERAKKSGIEISEVSYPLSKIEVEEMKEVSEEFFSNHLPSARSSRFLNRPFLYSEDPGAFIGGSRILIARSIKVLEGKVLEGKGEGHGVGFMHGKGQMLGFLVLDPMRRAGKIRGYYANITRARNPPAAHSGTSSLLIHHAITLIKNEHMPDERMVLSLGLSPFHCLHDRPSLFPLTSTALRERMEWAYKNCNSFYPYKGISRSKSSWGGGSLISNDNTPASYPYYPDPNVCYIPTYICHSRMLSPMMDLARIGVLCGMLDCNIVKNLRLLWQGRETEKEKESKEKDSDGSATIAAAAGHKMISNEK